MNKHKVDTPSVTIKWRHDEAPYVEISSGGQLLVAGWVHPSPDGMMKPVVSPANPALVHVFSDEVKDV
jgi:hypothetical protein